MTDLPTPALRCAVRRLRGAWIPTEIPFFSYKKEDVAKSLIFKKPIRQFLTLERQKWSASRQNSHGVLSFH